MKFKTSKKLFAHIDCDSFFASCEVYLNPRLKWKAVCVGREIVIAATYEAKAMWVKTWTPVWEAKKILKSSWVFLPLNMEAYWKLSRKLMKFLENNSISIERFSIDEAFVDITWIPEYYKQTPEEFALYVQEKIKKEIWLPVSIGIANTKIRAKILSKVNKPYWICDGSDSGELNKIFDKMHFSEIPFIWKSSQAKLRYKLSSINSFRQMKFWDVKKVLWKNWTDLWLELNWVSNFKAHWKIDMPKSISRTRSFNKHITNNVEFLKQEIVLNLSRAMEELTEKKLETRIVSLYLRNRDKIPMHISLKLDEHTLDREKILVALWSLFADLYSPMDEYRSTWVFFSDLRTHTPKQLSLINWNNKHFEKRKKLEDIISKVNSKLWRWILKIWG